MDVVADFAHILPVYEATTAAIRAAVDPELRLTLHTHFSHWYEWGSMIYPRVKIPEAPADLDAALALHDRIVDAATTAALEAGAVINDHHGIGMRLRNHLKRQLGPTGMQTLQRIKRALDPNNILCPGKLGLEG
jgi:alkyldihydroxyacetonephosphate synthase